MLGPPGAGKGTQATRIAAKLNVLHLSTSDMLRATVQSGTPIGKQAKAVMEKGELVPDQLVIAAVIERISQTDAEHGFILDGFPRTLAQATAFDEVLHEKHLDLDHVGALVEVDENKLLEWIRIRAREASACGRAVRTDGNPKALKVRIDAYNEQTSPLIAYYRSKGLLGNVDGLQSIGAVTTSVFCAMSLNA
jgi:adenylate kinase